MAATFVPRATFPKLDSIPRSYYLGHHAAGLAKMKTVLNQIDLVLECRDCRIPLTSRNPMFDEVLAEKERIIVYTKRDLGLEGMLKEKLKKQKLLREYHKPSKVTFSDSQSQQSSKRIIELVKATKARNHGLLDQHCLVVGMPNVGKSSLLNALRHQGVRKGKAASTGAQPGVTRKIGTGVKIVESTNKGRPAVYVLDTPGVFIPYVPDAEAMLKLALCGCVKDTIIDPYIVADYLLYQMNKFDPDVYVLLCTPTNDIAELLEVIARRNGRLLPGGVPDINGAAMWLVQHWRRGSLGHFILDEVSEEALERHRSSGAEVPGSLNQARKAEKAAAREKAKRRKSVDAG